MPLEGIYLTVRFAAVLSTKGLQIMTRLWPVSSDAGDQVWQQAWDFKPFFQGL